MTIKELISSLSDLYQDFEIILSSDAEGNDYNPICVVEVDVDKGQVIFYPV